MTRDAVSDTLWGIVWGILCVLFLPTCIADRRKLVRSYDIILYVFLNLMLLPTVVGWVFLLVLSSLPKKWFYWLAYSRMDKRWEKRRLLEPPPKPSARVVRMNVNGQWVKPVTLQ